MSDIGLTLFWNELPGGVPEKLCTKCGLVKPLTEFYRNKRRPDGRTVHCRGCMSQASAAWKEDNPERYRASKRLTDAAYQARPETREREKTRKATDYAAHRAERLTGMRDRHQANRAAVLRHYGRLCACCGTAEDLQVDHVKGGGMDWRLRTFGHKANAQLVYAWLVRNGFPAGFQLLCGLCNRSKKDSPHCRVHA